MEWGEVMLSAVCGAQGVNLETEVSILRVQVVLLSSKSQFSSLVWQKMICKMKQVK